jgi:parallel beta-helix repeat protein
VSGRAGRFPLQFSEKTERRKKGQFRAAPCRARVCKCWKETMNQPMKIIKARRHLYLGVVAGAALLLPLAVFAQGSLTPPGPPGPTMKTLDQVEPRIDLQNAVATAVTTTNANYHFIINQPGSYYLSANLGVTKTNGIQINAEGVTLDLNGFQISRSTGTGGYGVEIVATGHRASVRNGSVKGFGYGVAGSSRGCGFRDLSVSGCTSTAISAGPGAVLESCRVHDNTGSFGIVTDVGSSLTNCTAASNTVTNGILAGNGSTLTSCTCYNNIGAYGILAGTGCSLTNCTAYNNTVNYGIIAQIGSSLTNCSAYLNGSPATVSFGIGTGDSCTISHCTACYNYSSAALTSSAGMGFSIGNGSTIHDCTANSNKGDGIRILSDSVARDNACSYNGLGDGAGLHAIGSDNRIEGNKSKGNPRGIEVGGTNNLIIKNSAKGNTPNYSIIANNVFGLIIDRTAAVSAAVSGNSAPGSIGTTDPWANISH